MQDSPQSNIHSILTKYWGYKSFREKQEEIISSVLKGKDTLALLPTGGGKSICFQVPALAQQGICIVITPLIALMQDQVKNLKEKGIKALAIHSNMTSREIDIAFDNAIYGQYKFLYLSPERLETELFQVRVRKMNINLIAIDEAHCISQWGYDFRPSYLNIARVRKLIPKTPFIALTATATPEVVLDIQEQLKFKDLNSIQKSFERNNLTYVIQASENPLDKMLSVIKGVKGSGIVYLSSRKKTKEIADFLNSRGISALHYHAGLNFDERSQTQNAWISNSCRVIAATNAFGMGIDKPDVRFVVHLDAPESLEAYFQEAGRAGRDGKKAYAVFVRRPNMGNELLNKLDQKFPSIERIKACYTALCNFFQVPLGGGKLENFKLDIGLFSKRYDFNQREAFECIRFLEKEGYLELREYGTSQSKLFIKVKKGDLYKFQVAHQSYDHLIKTLLRTYGGLFDDTVVIQEMQIAKNSGIPIAKVKSSLVDLTNQGLIEYQAKSSDPVVLFLTERIDMRSLIINKKTYKQRREIIKNQLEEVANYISSDECRSRFLLNYFGEKNAKPCGKCDHCLSLKNKSIDHKEFENIKNLITDQLQKKSLLPSEMESRFKVNPEKLKLVLQWMIDEELVELKNQRFCFKPS